MARSSASKLNFNFKFMPQREVGCLFYMLAKSA